MTNNLIACATGAVVAAMQLIGSATAPGGVDIPALGGVGLLVWIVIHQTKEVDKLREQLRQAQAKCGECRLARAANDTLIEAGRELLNDERENKNDTEGRRG